ncbi:uncharacterized protein LTR77_006552 [Saxophila tyrrhenica]|uniref:N-acetyltransferase domain-containing protein n=1 Tax=Saxophila tyrrhenica TaxID=1690608 RepID=A0AAV9P8K9_9PEZI|nr:hypothetical protein LTR77_006552 [Saxophila tyrrhenica]
MPLNISPLLHSDIPAFALVEAAAAAHWPFALAMEVPGTPRTVFVEDWARQTLDKPNARWMKVSDAETGEMVSAALWHIPARDSEEGVEGEGGKRREEEGVGQPDPMPLLLAAERAWKVFEKEWIGDRPYALLSLLVTHPHHQRRGAGTLLVKQFCRDADAQGLLSAVTASEAGEAVYAKQGFVVKKVDPMDLRPYGVDATDLKRRMLREVGSDEVAR